MELKKGINFGGWYSQCDHSQERYDTFITEKDYAQVAQWGFDHIRLPFDYMLVQDNDGKFKEEGFLRLDRAVDWARQHGLDIILDLHKAAGYDFNDAGNAEKNNIFSSSELQEKFLSLWDKVSERYAGRPNVAFELLNEVVEADAAERWNSLISRAVAVIRKHSPEGKIIYGGIQWNSARTVKLLEVPADKNIIFTFHMYEPLIFTHQKAPWVPGMDPNKDIFYPRSLQYYKEESYVLGYKGKDVTDTDGAADGSTIIERMISEAAEAAKKAGAALYCGEYGVIDRAPVEDTAAWFRDIHKVFAKHDIGHAVWSYRQMDFGISDEHYSPVRDELIRLMTEPHSKA